MFCKKCGRKIRSGEKKCPSCGTSSNQAEYCGGFWGLVGEEPKQPRQDAAPEMRIKSGTEQAAPNKFGRKALTAACAVCGILAVAVVFLSVRTADLRDSIDYYKTERNRILSSYTELQEENAELKANLEWMEAYIQQTLEDPHGSQTERDDMPDVTESTTLPFDSENENGNGEAASSGWFGN